MLSCQDVGAVSVVVLALVTSLEFACLAGDGVSGNFQRRFIGVRCSLGVSVVFASGVSAVFASGVSVFVLEARVRIDIESFVLSLLSHGWWRVGRS